MTIRPVCTRRVVCRSPLLLLFFVLFFVLFFHGCTNRQKTDTLQVVASIEPLVYFVDRIGGERVSVSVMVPAGGNPHTYEPTPKQMALFGRSDLFVKAGSGVEFELDWMGRLLDLNRSIAVCNASDGILLLPMEEQEHDSPVGEHHQEHGNLDPHFWLSPSRARLIAATLERSLSALDPAGKAYYAANLATLDRELVSLDREIRSRLAGVSHRRFLVFHPAWGYFAHDFGLSQIAAEVEGKTLTPRQLQRVIEEARAEGIRVVFVSPQFSTAQAAAIARDIGGKTVTVDPLARNYQENLRHATEVFARSLQ
ncbi:MAG: zinc ABC transporter solute-binding protein [Chlorobiaceae bacterium]|nr:zinc ABC transporter solute-binding protein [Chlorobiaceae bacterium]